MTARRRDRLIVDGYNAVHAWPSLKTVLRRHGLEAARRGLITALSGYAAMREIDITVVFDAHDRVAVRADRGVMEDGVRILYGNTTASADNVIERLVSDAARAKAIERLVVATSDRLQREMVRAMGVPTVNSETLEAEVVNAVHDVGDQSRRMDDHARFVRRVEHQVSDEMRDRLERLRRGEDDLRG